MPNDRVLTDPQRAQLEGLLREELATTRARLVDLTAELRSIVESSEGANIDDEHDPEGATIAFERAMVLTLLDTARTHESELEKALDPARGAHLQGRCVVCGDTIPWERLLAQPTASTCVDCA